MTVKELIKLLEKVGQEKNVVLASSSEGCMDALITSVEERSENVEIGCLYDDD